MPSTPERLVDQLRLGGGVNSPEASLARLLLRPGHFDKVSVEGQVVTDGVLPTLVSSPVVRVVLGYVGINSRKGQLFVSTLGHSLNDQLSIAKWRLGLVLQETRTRLQVSLGSLLQFFCLKLTLEDEVPAIAEPAAAEAPPRGGDNSWQFSGSAG